MWNTLKKWWKNRNIDYFSPAPWHRTIPNHPNCFDICPICDDPIIAWRMVVGEDLAQVNETWGVHPCVCRIIVGREYLHADSKYCAERFVEYTPLTEPKRETIREAKPEEGWPEEL